MNKLSKKTILLVVLMLTMTVFSCITVFAFTPLFKPLYVQINETPYTNEQGDSGYKFNASYWGVTPGGSADGPTGAPDTVKYSWDFGDGSTSKDQRPNHLYANPGTYEVKLHIEIQQYSPGTPSPDMPAYPSLVVYSGNATKTVVVP